MLRLELLTFPGSVASHQSALILHQIAGYQLDWRTVHLCTKQRIRSPGVASHQLPPGSTILNIRDAKTVDAATALAQFTTQAAVVSAVVSIDDALNRNLVNLTELRQRFAEFPPCRGSSRLAPALAQADPFAESPGETRNRLFVKGLGIQVISQVPVGPLRWQRQPRADAQVRGTRLLIEFDGRGKYVQDGALFAEKRREDWLREIGFEFARITSDDLADPPLAKQRIAQALAREARAARLRDPIGPCRYPEPWLWRPLHECTAPHTEPVPGEVSLLHLRRR